MVIELPLPPSVNAAYFNRKRGGRAKTKEYRTWLRNADVYFLKQKRSLVRFTGPCIVVVHVPMNMRGDASNRIKLPEDYLVSREITGDDQANRTVTANRNSTVPPGLCHVEVTAA